MYVTLSLSDIFSLLYMHHLAPKCTLGVKIIAA